MGFLPQRACPKLQDRRSAKVLSAPITGTGSQPRENTRRNGAQLPPVEGAVSLQTTSQRQLDPSPTGRNFQRFSQGPKPHLGLQKCGVVFDNYILLIRQFYRLSVFSFSTSRSCTHTVNQLKLSLDKKAAETERTVRIRARKDLGIPPWLNPTSFRPGNSLGR